MAITTLYVNEVLAIGNRCPSTHRKPLVGCRTHFSSAGLTAKARLGGISARALSGACLRMSQRRGHRLVPMSAVLSPDTCFIAGTVFVMPFYTAMLAIPKSSLTKTMVSSPAPYLIMSVLYLYLLVVSWQPDSLRLIMNPDFYFLPQLTGIATLFSRAPTVASAWIHLLCVDLYAAIQVYQDSVKHQLPSKASLVLCMMCCPVGILAHFITKAIVLGRRKRFTDDVLASPA
mmetsp:Transcript_46489/g.88771  ORF Transcript_46489/g.88771 Transcript_46489/m.88771 type:complete len:231 (-) Transcript_46489:308-1000(-)|eukprot:CAMPEP_0114251536 /NCGR_PEP_ID=MMETSP0058-20121206/15324_1 /TAXON_ID=36894 /ORGANISM="Pyramimonas parkeae, CCMP726" /LENGTH=230 /DNA_ID=CAMNT_0001365347 /DNA_START=48 /DNA_END=740 /DNA_ORIENTATION=-